MAAIVGLSNPTTQRGKTFGIAALVIVALMVLATSGCDVPDVEGPQIQTRPPGFTMNPDTYLERRMFPDLEAIKKFFDEESSKKGLKNIVYLYKEKLEEHMKKNMELKKLKT